MTEQRTQNQQESPLQTERGITRVEDSVVQKIAGLAVQEIEGIQMGGGTARAVGGLLDSVSGGGGESRGVSVEAGEEETAIDLALAMEYGRPIPRVSEEVRRNVIRRVENLVGLRVVEVNITVNDVLVPRSVHNRRGSASQKRILKSRRNSKLQG